MKKRIRILLTGKNYASVINSLAHGFEKSGVKCNAITFEYGSSKYNRVDKVYSVYENYTGKFIPFTYYKIKGLLYFFYLFLRADVLHVYSDIKITSKRKELILLKLFRKKKKFITFLGSEVRNPDVSLHINPYFKYGWFDEQYEYKSESASQSNYIQKIYADGGFKAIVWDVDVYLNKTYFQEFAIAPHASFNNVQAEFIENIDNKKIVIVHSPSAPTAKGTKYVLKAIEQLNKLAPGTFEFKLLQNVSNDEYQTIIQKCDIFIDQLIWGAYGIAAQQALEYGKVVVCYLLEERIQRYYGVHCPIQNATIDNLAEVLQKLISNPKLRNEISVNSRNYYKKMHLPLNVANRMIELYNLPL